MTEEPFEYHREICAEGFTEWITHRGEIISLSYEDITKLLNELSDEKEYWKQKYKQELEKNSIITVAFDKNGNVYPISKKEL